MTQIGLGKLQGRIRSRNRKITLTWRCWSASDLSECGLGLCRNVFAQPRPRADKDRREILHRTNPLAYRSVLARLVPSTSRHAIATKRTSFDARRRKPSASNDRIWASNLILREPRDLKRSLGFGSPAVFRRPPRRSTLRQTRRRESLGLAVGPDRLVWCRPPYRAGQWLLFRRSETVP